MKVILFSLLLFMGGYVFSAENIPLTLRNTTAHSIPLVIPGVMNPNLNPFSTSGVSLDTGQKIYFVYKKKQYLLLEVAETTAKDLDVARLIKERKKELGLE